MRILQVEIKNFRGIKKMGWKPAPRLNCLIGPGDSGKTTVLEAIERALTSSEPAFTDADFTDLDSTNDIEIEVTVGNLPAELLLETRLGLHLRGWHATEGLKDEPIPDEPGASVVTIRLTVPLSLEPRWEVVTDRGARPINYRERALLGMARVGGNVAWHLTWSKRSALNRATTGEDAQKSLAEAVRAARGEFARAPLADLKTAASEVGKRAAALGAVAKAGLQPLINPAALSIAQGAVALHDGVIPLAAAGLGTQRLSAIAVQQLTVPAGAILLLDEIESGLEPHRLRHLIRFLRDDGSIGQVILTSHSSVAISELDAPELVAARNRAGALEMRAADLSLQAVVRSTSEAMLSPSILVCEGKTEVGLCRGWDRAVWEKKGLPALAVKGCFPIDGGGETASERALGLAKLGYRVALFVDGEKAVNRRVELEAAGIPIFEWPGRSTEQVVAAELPLEDLQLAVNLAIADRGVDPIRGMVASKLRAGSPEDLNIESLATWSTVDAEVNALRTAIAEASVAKDKAWFKRIDRGHNLGVVVASALDRLEGSALAKMISDIGAWAHAM